MATPLSSSTEPTSLAASFAATFRVVPAAGLSHWFDERHYEVAGPGEFHQAIGARELIESPAGLVWPPLMPPDFLPLIGNGVGDWICARVDGQSVIGEFVHWYHGGGDWISWGEDLNHALIFDCVRSRLPGPRRQHSVAPEFRDGIEMKPEALLKHPWMRWALSVMETGPAEIIRTAISKLGSKDDSSGEEMAQSMLDLGISSEAVRCELLQSAGDDWQRVEATCREMPGAKGNHAWAWEWLGRSLIEQRRLNEAVTALVPAALCSAFTDQSVRLKSPFDGGRDCKFSISMMNQLIDSHDSKRQRMSIDKTDGFKPSTDDSRCNQVWTESQLSEFLAVHGVRIPRRDLQHIHRLLTDDVEQVRHSVYKACFAEALELKRTGEYAAAYESLWRAGWDLGTGPIAVYEPLLEMMVEVAELSGQHGRATVAEVHLKSFRERYGGIIPSRKRMKDDIDG